MAVTQGTILPGDPRLATHNGRHSFPMDQLAVASQQQQVQGRSQLLRPLQAPLTPLVYISSQEPYQIRQDGGFGYRYHVRGH